MTITLRKRMPQIGNTEAGNLSVLLLTVIMVISLVPIASRNCPNAIYYGLLVAFLFSVAEFYLKIDSGKKMTVCAIAAYLIIIALYKFMGISSSALSYYSTIVKFLFFPLAMIAIVEHLSFAQKKFIISVILIVVAIVLIDNLRLYQQYGPIRYVGLFQTDRFTSNCINTPYVASLVFLGGALFSFFLYERRKTLKYTALFYSASCLMFIVAIAQRALVFGMVLLMIPLLILYNGKNTGRRVFLMGVAFIAAIILAVNIHLVLDMIKSLTDSVRLGMRIDQLKTYLSSGDITAAGGSLTGRYELTKRSILTWTASPLSFFFGAGDHRANNYTIGNHCFFFDELARYGITGLLIWGGMLFSILKQLRICSGIEGNDRLIRLLHVLIFMYCFRSLIGNIIDPVLGIQVFIFTPILFSMMQYDKNQQYI